MWKYISPMDLLGLFFLVYVLLAARDVVVPKAPIGRDKNDISACQLCDVKSMPRTCSSRKWSHQKAWICFFFVFFLGILPWGFITIKPPPFGRLIFGFFSNNRGQANQRLIMETWYPPKATFTPKGNQWVFIVPDHKAGYLSGVNVALGGTLDSH